MLPLLSPIIQTFAATSTLCPKPTLFGLESWYAYLPFSWSSITGHCEVSFPTDPKTNTVLVISAHSGFLLIGLAILDDLIRIAAMVAVGYVIYGGIQYMTGNGSPDSVKRAQSTIINALIGLVIAILAASIVSYIGNSLG
jgi:hypothetical protein